MESTQAYCHKAVTEYTEEAYNALAFLMIRKIRKMPRILLIVSGLVTTVISAGAMLQSSSVLAFILLLVGIIVTLAGIFAQRLCVKMMMASNQKGKAPKNTYLFAEDKLYVQTPDADKEYTYGNILRFTEVSGYLFLFMSDGLMFLIGLKDVKGEIKTFRAFLEKKIAKAAK